MNTSPTPSVLVATDGSKHSTLALDWAAKEAADRGASLRVITVQDPVGGGVLALDPVRQSAATAECKRILSEAIDYLRPSHDGLEITGEVGRGRPSEVIATTGDDADLIVVGSRGRGGFTGLLLGSTSLRVAGRAGVPLVVVPGRAGEGAGNGVVVAVDGSEASRRALAFAADYADNHGVPLTAVMVVHDSNQYAKAEETKDSWVQDAVATAKTELGKVIAETRESHPELEITEVVEKGHPVGTVRKVAEGAGLVVAGSRGRSLGASTLLGSVSHALMHHADVPVAVVTARD